MVKVEWSNGMEKKRRVLIADESTFICVVLTTALKKLGFEVVDTAKTGSEAMDKYMKYKPDIVLMDVKLREMDGIEATRSITNADSSAVVIMLIEESLDIPDIIVEVVKAGARGYIKKPLSPERIGAYMEGVLKKSRG